MDMILNEYEYEWIWIWYKKFTFWIFWERPLYEISKYAFNQYEFVCLSVSLSFQNDVHYLKIVMKSLGFQIYSWLISGTLIKDVIYA